MINQNNAISLSQAARIAGIGYLIMAFLGIFANFTVLEGLIIPDDAAQTATNIMDSEGLFRAGIVSFIIIAMLDVLVAWGLHVLLQPVNKSLSLLAAWLRIVYAGILAIAVLNLLMVMQVLSGIDYLTGFDTAQLQAQAMLFLDAFSLGWLIGLVFFGLHLLVFGYLVYQSNYMPRILGIFLMVAGAGYIIDSLAHFILSNYTDYESIFLVIVAVPSLVGELSVTFWLLLRGGKIENTASDVRKSAHI